MKMITAIVLDGFHSGHVVRMDCQPILKLLRPTVIKVDYCCGGDEMPPQGPEFIDYKECFRGVDQNVVLYSQSGNSLDILRMFNWEYSLLPWTQGTTLRMGYHDEPIIRIDESVETVDVAENKTL
jgi:hypothetical protein